MLNLTKTKVYVAGPYSNGDTLSDEERLANTEIAMKAGGILLGYGYMPFIPHLTHFWDSVHHRHYEDWLEYGKEWMRPCHCVLLLPGDSVGADKEGQFAAELGIPMFDCTKALAATVPIRLPEGNPGQVLRGAMKQIEQERMTQMLSDD